MKRFLALVFVLFASSCLTDVVIDGEHGTVYECRFSDYRDEPTKTLELCWAGDVAELESWLHGRTCDITSRGWPRLVGCDYLCGDPGGHTGCNAHDGCACVVPMPARAPYSGDGCECDNSGCYCVPGATITK